MQAECGAMAQFFILKKLEFDGEVLSSLNKITFREDWAATKP